MNSLLVPTAQLNQAMVAKVLECLQEDIHAKKMLQAQSDHYTIRDTIAFGYDYFALIEGNTVFVAIPSYLQALCQACIDALGPNYALGTVQDYSNVIVSIYRQGYRLQPHVDVEPQEDRAFYFGDDVLGVILAADSAGKFYLVQGESEAEVAEKPPLWTLDEMCGTVFLLTGAARSQPYFHGVTQVSDWRVSVTFRTVIFK